MDARDLGARVRAASPARPRGAADPPRFFASPSRGSEGPGARATLAAGIAAHLAPPRAAAPLGGSTPAATPPPTPTSLGLPPLTPPPLPAFATHAAPEPENGANPPAPAPAPAPAPPEGTRFVAAHTHFDRLFASLPRPALRALLEGHPSSSAPPWGERRPGSAPFPPSDPDEKDENDERAKKSNPAAARARAAPPALPPRALPGDLAPAPPPRHRLAEMKKAAKAVRSRDALLALLEAGTSLSDAVPRKEPPLRKPPRYLFPSLDDDDAKRAATDANDDGSARPRPGGGAKRTLGVGRRASEDASSGSEDDEDLSAPPPTLRDSGSETNAESESSEDSEEASTLRRDATPKKTPPPLPPLRRPLTLLGTRPGVGARPRRLNESATAAAAMADDAAAARAGRAGGDAGGPDSRGGVAADDPPSLPFVAGAVVIVALGEIDLARSARASSSSSYVLPVGFVSRRRYNSAVAPGERTWYESSVHRDTDEGGAEGGADDGKNAAEKRGQHREESGQQQKKEGVLVRVRDVGASGGAVPGELRDARVFTGPSPTHAWQQAIRAVNEVNQTRKRAAVSGPQFMGLSSPVVAQEIAKLPGYKECREAMRAEERAKSANKRRKKKKEALLSKGEKD